MAQAAPAKVGSTTWRVFGLETAATALFLLVLTIWQGDMLLWAVQSAIAAPLLVLSTVALFLLPGLALLRLLWPQRLEPAERWALAPGLSAIAAPLLMLASIFGVHWNGVLSWLVLIVCGAVAFWPRREKNQEPRTKGATLSGGSWFSSEQYRLLLALLGVTLVAMLVRLFAVRDLPGGMFGDSYHHTMIAQLLVDHGGLFRSWQPYAPLETFTYHYGFHSNVAWLSLLSGVPVEKTLLVVGQIENGLIVPLVFVFAKRITGNTRAGLWAGALAAFASTLPAYYVNWGRYTQLAGQTILPAACVVWMALLDQATGDGKNDSGRGEEGVRGRQSHTTSSFIIHPSSFILSRRWTSVVFRFAVLAALATAGLIVTHYRVAVFAGCFVVAYGLYRCFSPPRSSRKLLQLMGVTAAAGMLGVAIALPWLLRIREGTLLRIADNLVSQNIGAGETNNLPGFNELIGFFFGRIIVALAIVGITALLVRRDWRGLVLLLWPALVLLAANPYLLGLTGAGILTNFAVLIAAYLMLAPLAGIGADTLFVLAERFVYTPLLGGSSRGNLLAPTVSLVGALALMLYGLSWQRNIVDPSYQVLTEADAEAAQWVAREIPPGAKIFVNGFPAYGSLVVGSDGGWWLPLLSGHQTNVPPVTYGSEATRPGFMTAVRDLNRDFRATTLAAPDAPARLRAAGYSYLYDGPTAAKLPAGISELITPEVLQNVAGYEVVYRKGGVTIWKVR